LSYVKRLISEIRKAEEARKLFSGQLLTIQSENRRMAFQLRDAFKMEDILRAKLSEQEARIKAIRADLERFKE
jgi:exosome complex RNA-binding protein Csl4